MAGGFVVNSDLGSFSKEDILHEFEWIIEKKRIFRQVTWSLENDCFRLVYLDGHLIGLITWCLVSKWCIRNLIKFKKMHSFVWERDEGEILLIDNIFIVQAISYTHSKELIKSISRYAKCTVYYSGLKIKVWIFGNKA